MSYNTRHALKLIGMGMYHPLDKNYSNDIWFKSTLHSLVYYAQHSDSIYFPIYTYDFFQHFFTKKKQTLGAEFCFLIYWPPSLLTLG